MTVMLATQSKTVAPTPVEAITKLSGEGWWFELKWDGVRCLLHKSGNGITLINRNGRDITERYPDLVEAGRTLPYEQVCLDGEIVAFDASGRPDFTLLASRDRITSAAKAKAKAETLPVYFMAFDLLAIDSHDYRSSPYEIRRKVLEEVRDENTSPRVKIGIASQNGDVMWQFVQDRTLEGLVAKKPHSPYVPARSPAWIKIRRTVSVSCVVTGYEPGTGWADGLVGALTLGLLDGPTLVDVGKVGTGFSKKERKELLRYFSNGRPSEDLVVEVEFQELSNDGRMRFPSYRGIRTDVPPTACDIAQIQTQ